MFFQTKEKLLDITCILFVNNLGFLISSFSISIVEKLLGKASRIVLK